MPRPYNLQYELMLTVEDVTLVGLSEPQILGVGAMHDAVLAIDQNDFPRCVPLIRSMQALATFLGSYEIPEECDIALAREQDRPIPNGIPDSVAVLVPVEFFLAASDLHIQLLTLKSGICPNVVTPIPDVVIERIEEAPTAAEILSDPEVEIREVDPAPIVQRRTQELSGSRAGLSTGYKIGIVGGVLAAGATLWLVLRRK